MGYRGKVEEQIRARDLRARSWTLADIAAELGVAKSSVSRWVRDVDFVPNPRRTARNRRPNKLQRAKAAEIERFREEGRERFATLTDEEFFAAGLGLYAGDGSKKGGSVAFANSDPALVSFVCAWLRTFFDIDESRLRVQLYLHADLDLEAANAHWSGVTGVPVAQFHKPYRAVVDETRRHSRHLFGCCHVRYASRHTLRRMLGMMEALVLVPSNPSIPG